MSSRAFLTDLGAHSGDEAIDIMMGDFIRSLRYMVSNLNGARRDADGCHGLARAIAKANGGEVPSTFIEISDKIGEILAMVKEETDAING